MTNHTVTSEASNEARTKYCIDWSNKRIVDTWKIRTRKW